MSAMEYKTRRKQVEKQAFLGSVAQIDLPKKLLNLWLIALRNA
jgi:hypothetical protein